MKKITISIISILILICLAFFGYQLTQKSKNVSYDHLVQQAIKAGVAAGEHERVSCSSTATSRCFRYRCDSGFVYSEPVPIPGGSGLSCTDGSAIKEVGEVE